jgi:hypothetical protein
MATEPIDVKSTNADVAAVRSENAAAKGVGVEGIAGVDGTVLGASLKGIAGVFLGGVGVAGAAGSGGIGVLGQATLGNGVLGRTTGGLGSGVFGDSPQGSGVKGQSKDGIGTIGKSGDTGLLFDQPTGVGVWGTSKDGVGVQGESRENSGVLGVSAAGFGLSGVSQTSTGVKGDSTSADGVFGVSATGIGVHGKGGKLAALFEGDVEVTGDIHMPNADCAEDFDIAPYEVAEPGAVMVLSNSEGTLSVSHQPYDRRVAGVVSGAGNYKPAIVLDKRHTQNERRPIALLGKVYCKVDAGYGQVEVGDLLTTSATPGHAMKATDSSKAFGAVIGKALRPLKEGQALIPVLISMQ